MRILLVALLAFFVGCSAPVSDPRTAPITLALDCEPELPDICDRAISVWSPALEGTRWTLLRGSEGSVTKVVFYVERAEHVCVDTEEWNGCSLATTIELNRSAFVGWRDPDTGKVQTLLHEIGHSLGLGHRETGLMATDRLPRMCIDSVTAEAIGGVPTCSDPSDDPLSNP